jgi:hypothetical protein
MDAVDVFIELVHSLKTPNAMGVLTDSVDELMQTPSYFEAGYPKDLFVYDKRQLQTNARNIECIYAHKERCTTFASSKEEPLTVGDEFFTLYEAGQTSKMAIPTLMSA